MPDPKCNPKLLDVLFTSVHAEPSKLSQLAPYPVPIYPATTIPFVLVDPNAPACVRPVVREVVAVQDDPFQVSAVLPCPSGDEPSPSPVATIAFQFDDPQLVVKPFALFKSPTSVQLVPSQDSAIT